MPAPVPVGDWDAYLWIVVCGGLASAFMAWGIGANDVANSFATSVGSRTLKLWQACIIASIFEFTGAIALGGETTKTVASDISNVNLYKEFPEIYMYGMLCSLAVAGTWLLIATYWCLAVSTTHSIIGAIMGFSLVFGGWDGVIWNSEKGQFPFTGGFLPVVLSWFFSPIVGGILASIIFNLCRFGILRRQNSTNLAIYSIPLLLFITFFINLMFVLAKGAGSDMKKRWPCEKTTGYHDLPIDDCTDMYNASAWIAAVVAAGIGIIGGAIAIPLLKRRMAREMEEMQNAAVNPSAMAVGGQSVPDVEKLAALEDADPKAALQQESGQALQRHETVIIHQIPKDASALELPGHYAKHAWTTVKRQVMKGLFYDIHTEVSYDKAVADMHAACEVFKPETERVFQFLQVFSACCVSFAHGSNDVANSIGPFSAIYTTYQTWAVPSSKTDTPKWIFAFGGALIVVGVITYGYNIIMTIGVNLLKLTPSRGFSAELAAGLTISLASFYGIPVSTTQIIVGCEVGVGMSENLKTGTNYKLLLKTFFGWIWTIVIALIFCAALFSAGAYAPSITMANQISDYNLALWQNANAKIFSPMQATNNQFKSDTVYWTSPNPTNPLNGSSLDKLISSQNSSYYGALIDTKTNIRKYMDLPQALYYYNSALQLQSNFSKTTIGA